MNRILSELEGKDSDTLIEKYRGLGFLEGLNGNPLNLAIAYELACHYLLDDTIETTPTLIESMFPILYRLIPRFESELENEDILFIITRITVRFNDFGINGTNINYGKNVIGKFVGKINEELFTWDYLGHYGDIHQKEWNQTLLDKFDYIVSGGDVVVPNKLKGLLETIDNYKVNILSNKYNIQFVDKESNMICFGDKFLIIENY